MGQGNDIKTGSKTSWSVVVVYEDATAREEAVRFCDHLMRRFWSRYEFLVGWWSFGVLQLPQEASKEAAEKAREADVIVVATRPESEIPPGIRDWIETWSTQRGDREGALVGLMDPGGGASGAAAEKYVYLRSVAHRGAMDYLTEVPQSLSWRAVPDSLDSFNERADRVTSVLDDILHKPVPAPQLRV
jgi:hypothetical protein